MSNAYRRLSDANLLRSGGALAEIGRRKKSDDQSGGGRLNKDYLSPDGDEMLDDSSDDGDSSQEEGERGRKAARSFEGLKPDSDNKGGPNSARKSLSLLAAAEEERKSTISFPFQHPGTNITNSLFFPTSGGFSSYVYLAWARSRHHIHPHHTFLGIQTLRESLHTRSLLYTRKHMP
jgi:hypothetical protein